MKNDNRPLIEIAEDPHTCWFCGDKATQCRIYEFSKYKVRPTTPWSYKETVSKASVKVNVCPCCFLHGDNTESYYHKHHALEDHLEEIFIGIFAIGFIILFNCDIIFNGEKIDIVSLIGKTVFAIIIGGTFGLLIGGKLNDWLSKGKKYTIKRKYPIIRTLSQHPDARRLINDGYSIK